MPTYTLTFFNKTKPLNDKADDINIEERVVVAPSWEEAEKIGMRMVKEDPNLEFESVANYGTDRSP